MNLNALLDRTAILQPVLWPFFEKAGISVTVLREDLRHPLLGGNKLWKLKYNLQRAAAEGRKAVVSFGGAYSNHLLALSEACRISGLRFHAVVRGEEAPMNERLHFMKNAGTRLHFISRDDYRRKTDDDFVRALLERTGVPQEALVIPEGGNNAEGRHGCKELGALIPRTAQWVACAVGTAGTISGMIGGLTGTTCALGITVVRSGDEPEMLLNSLGTPVDRYRIIKGYEAGGYGKSTPELSAFCEAFTSYTGIPLETVYTGKLFFALSDLAQQGYFGRGDEVVALHSGGIFS